MITPLSSNLPQAAQFVQRPEEKPEELSQFLDLRTRIFYEVTHPQQEKALNAANLFVSRILSGSPSPHWLTFLGKPGTGKTLLASAIRDALGDLIKNLDVQFWSWTSVCNDYLRAWNFGILPHLARLDVLVLDDIGVTSSPMTNEKLYELLESRLGKWTVITSNLLMNDISEKIDPRVTSRLIRGGSKLIILDAAKDYALIQNS